MATPTLKTSVDGEPLDVVVVGGSLSGLMYGIVLSRLGHNVRILEKYPSWTRDNQAGGITAGPYMRDFLRVYDRSPEPLWLPCDGMQVLKADGTVGRFWKFPSVLTSWDVLYYRMRANFDGLISDYCPRILSREARKDEGQTRKLGEAVFENGKQVTNIFYVNGTVIIEWQSVKGDDSQGILTADLVVAADGANSVVTRILLYEATSQPKYAGYVAWRGTVPESEVSENTRNLFQGHLSSFVLRGEYILGPRGSLAPGERLLNFVWYRVQSSSVLSVILTSQTGHQHRRSMPAGSLKPEIWDKQREHGNQVLSPAFRGLINAVSQPFVQAIVGAVASQAVLCEGHVLLAGEAFAILRPHTALGVNVIARAALELSRLGSGREGLEELESIMLREVPLQRWWSVAFGCYFLSGAWACGSDTR